MVIMTETTLVTIMVAAIATIPPTMTAMFAYLASKKNAKEITDLKISVDGRLTQLLTITGQAQHAAGRVEGIENERDRATVAVHAVGVAKNVESIATDISAVKEKLVNGE